jgi:hypothetical protein
MQIEPFVKYKRHSYGSASCIEKKEDSKIDKLPAKPE